MRMDEEMAFENMPEGIQMSYRGEMSEEAQSNMDDAISQIDEYGEGSEATEEEKESALQELIDNVTDALTMAAE